MNAPVVDHVPAARPHRTAASENFPVASHLIAPKHRGAVMAFYRFARVADDIVDDGRATPEAKLDGLERMRAALVGETDTSPEAVALRSVLAERGLDPTHPLDLLAAFRRDAANVPVTDWEDLLDYCRLSAMPVGRFVLDAHSEARATWPANDALCAALQVINHVQDCGEDWREMGRVYLPADWLAAEGVAHADLAAPRASPGLRRVFARAVAATDELLRACAGFAGLIRDRRLGLEVAVIHRLAIGLNDRLRHRDPLAGGVHHNRLETLGLTLGAVAGGLFGRRS